LIFSRFWNFTTDNMSKTVFNKIIAKLERLDEYLRYLADVQKVNKKSFLNDYRFYGLAERYLQLAIEVILDVGKLIIITEKLEKPEDMFWWLGYVGHSDVPEVFNVIMTKLKQPEWRLYAKKGFELLGLDFEHFAAVDFAKKPNEMIQMKVGFEKILADGGVLRKQKLVI